MSENNIIEHPLKKYWRPMAAVVYLLICIFDFVIMPSIVEASNTKASNQQAVELALKFAEPAAQIQALQAFTEKRAWNPLTLLGGGLFHISFGAIIGVSAWTRGMEKKQHAANGIFMN